VESVVKAVNAVDEVLDIKKEASEERLVTLDSLTQQVRQTVTELEGAVASGVGVAEETTGPPEKPRAAKTPSPVGAKP
jgi:hypothetical protein